MFLSSLCAMGIPVVAQRFRCVTLLGCVWIQRRNACSSARCLARAARMPSEVRYSEGHRGWKHSRKWGSSGLCPKTSLWEHALRKMADVLGAPGRPCGRHARGKPVMLLQGSFASAVKRAAPLASTAAAVFTSESSSETSFGSADKASEAAAAVFPEKKGATVPRGFCYEDIVPWGSCNGRRPCTRGGVCPRRRIAEVRGNGPGVRSGGRQTLRAAMGSQGLEFDDPWRFRLGVWRESFGGCRADLAERGRAASGRLTSSSSAKSQLEAPDFQRQLRTTPTPHFGPAMRPCATPGSTSYEARPTQTPADAPKLTAWMWRMLNAWSSESGREAEPFLVRARSPKWGRDLRGGSEVGTSDLGVAAPIRDGSMDSRPTPSLERTFQGESQADRASGDGPGRPT